MNARGLIFVAAGVAAAIALWVLIKPQPPAAPVSTAPVAVTWTLEQGHRTAGASPIRIPQGSTLQLTIFSDTEDELHVHGYDVGAHLTPGAPVTMTITAERSGRFEIELHNGHGDIGALEVMPR